MLSLSLPFFVLLNCGKFNHFSAIITTHLYTLDLEMQSFLPSIEP